MPGLNLWELSDWEDIVCGLSLPCVWVWAALERATSSVVGALKEDLNPH